MNDLGGNGAPFYFAMRRPPTAAALDEDVYLTVTAGVPSDPERLESIDIILSIGFGRHVIAQLTDAIATAISNQSQ